MMIKFLMAKVVLIPVKEKSKGLDVKITVQKNLQSVVCLNQKMSSSNSVLIQKKLRELISYSKQLKHYSQH